jgi:hypothetical protein
VTRVLFESLVHLGILEGVQTHVVDAWVCRALRYVVLVLDSFAGLLLSADLHLATMIVQALDGVQLLAVLAVSYSPLLNHVVFGILEWLNSHGITLQLGHL